MHNPKMPKTNVLMVPPSWHQFYLQTKDTTSGQLREILKNFCQETQNSFIVKKTGPNRWFIFTKKKLTESEKQTIRNRALTVNRPSLSRRTSVTVSLPDDEQRQPCHNRRLSWGQKCQKLKNTVMGRGRVDDTPDETEPDASDTANLVVEDEEKPQEHEPVAVTSTA